MESDSDSASSTSSAPENSNDSRKVLIRRLQPTAASAVKRLKDSAKMAEDWALPARAFPQSVLIMAACQVSGSDVRLRTIQLNIEIPHLRQPQSSLNALLEYCSVLGRRSFELSEQKMRSLDRMAHSAQGKIEYIMHLFGRPERDTALQEALQDFQNLASDLTTEVNVIDAAFQQWSDFTDSLRIHLSQRLGSIPTESLLEDEISSAQANLDVAKQTLDEAKAEYERQDRELSEVMSKEASLQKEILDRIEELVPSDSRSWPGIRNILRIFWSGEGKSKKSDERHQKIMEILQTTSNEREKSAVRQQVQVHSDKLKQAEIDRNNAKQQHKEAFKHFTQTSCNRSQRNLKLLGESKLDLKTIEKILSESTDQLKALRQQISDLSRWFTGVSELVNHAVSTYQDFQRGLQLGQSEYTHYEKRRLLKLIYQIQARLTTISNISNTYNCISTKYIRTGLNTIESLSRADLELYRAKQKELQVWCDESSQEIEQLTLERIANIPIDVDACVDKVSDTALSRCQFWAGV